MELEVTAVIDRPVSLVWDFFAVHQSRTIQDGIRTSNSRMRPMVRSALARSSGAGAPGSRLRQKERWKSPNSNPSKP